MRAAASLSVGCYQDDKFEYLQEAVPQPAMRRLRQVDYEFFRRPHSQPGHAPGYDKGLSVATNVRLPVATQPAMRRLRQEHERQIASEPQPAG